MNNLISIKFNNGEIWSGGSIGNSCWASMPNLSIQKLTYTIFNKQYIFNNYLKYNHLLEKVYIFNQKELLTQCIIMGLKDNDLVEGYSFNLKTQQVIKFVRFFGQEYNGKPTYGWKEGIKSPQMESLIVLDI